MSLETSQFQHFHLSNDVSSRISRPLSFGWSPVLVALMCCAYFTSLYPENQLHYIHYEYNMIITEEYNVPKTSY
jgi:hypothetical protein